MQKTSKLKLVTCRLRLAFVNTRSSVDAEGPRDAPQIRNTARHVTQYKFLVPPKYLWNSLSYRLQFSYIAWPCEVLAF